MDELGDQIVYLTAEQICEVNRRMVGEFGGLFVPPDNLSNPHALEYILAAIESSVYGYNPYPGLKEKAAAIAHGIISRHVFTDGNKRTAIHVAWEFLFSNGIRVSLDTTIEDLALAVAKGDAGHKELLTYLHSHQ